MKIKIQKKITPQQFNKVCEVLDGLYIYSECGQVVPIQNMPTVKAHIIEELILILNQ